MTHMLGMLWWCSRSVNYPLSVPLCGEYRYRYDLDLIVDTPYLGMFLDDCPVSNMLLCSPLLP